jgi:hypothetical protein
MKQKVRDQKTVIKRINEDYHALQTEFQEYRDNKLEQEKERDIYITKVERDFHSLSKNDISMKERLETKISNMQKTMDMN